MPDQTIQGALVKMMTIDAASANVPQYAAVLEKTTGEDVCTMPTAANAAGFAGIALLAGVPGDVIPVQFGGGLTRFNAAGVINCGDFLQIADASGRLQAAAQPQQNQLDVGLVAAANAVTPSKAAAGLAAVNVKTGTVTGPAVILPRGTAPTVTHQCSLNAAGTSVSFLAADAVATADIEYTPQQPTQAQIVGRSYSQTAALNDIGTMMPLHGTRQG